MRSDGPRGSKLAFLSEALGGEEFGLRQNDEVDSDVLGGLAPKDLLPPEVVPDDGLAPNVLLGVFGRVEFSGGLLQNILPELLED